MSVDFGIWGAQSDGFVLCCLLLKVFQVAPSGPPLPPPHKGPCSPRLLLSTPLLIFSSGFRVCRALQYRRSDMPHIFIALLRKRSWRLLRQVSVRVARTDLASLRFFWKSFRVRDPGSRVDEVKVSLGESEEMFSAELWVQGSGTALYIWQIDFCQQFSSVRLTVSLRKRIRSVGPCCALAEHLSTHSRLLKWLPLKLSSEEDLSSSVAAC